MTLETTSGQRAVWSRQVRMPQAKRVNALCRDVDTLLAALEGVMGGCVTGSHAGKDLLSCRACAAARELLQEAASAQAGD